MFKNPNPFDLAICVDANFDPVTMKEVLGFAWRDERVVVLTVLEDQEAEAFPILVDRRFELCSLSAAMSLTRMALVPVTASFPVGFAMGFAMGFAVRLTMRFTMIMVTLGPLRMRFLRRTRRAWGSSASHAMDLSASVTDREPAFSAGHRAAFAHAVARFSLVVSLSSTFSTS